MKDLPLNALRSFTAVYVAGGVLLVSTVVAFVVTCPDDVVKEYGTSVTTAPYVVPIEGGLMVGKVWTY